MSVSPGRIREGKNVQKQTTRTPTRLFSDSLDVEFVDGRTERERRAASLARKPRSEKTSPSPSRERERAVVPRTETVVVTTSTTQDNIFAAGHAVSSGERAAPSTNQNLNPLISSSSRARAFCTTTSENNDSRGPGVGVGYRQPQPSSSTGREPAPQQMEREAASTVVSAPTSGLPPRLQRRSTNTTNANRRSGRGNINAPDQNYQGHQIRRGTRAQTAHETLVALTRRRRQKMTSEQLLVEAQLLDQRYHENLRFLRSEKEARTQLANSNLKLRAKLQKIYNFLLPRKGVNKKGRNFLLKLITEVDEDQDLQEGGLEEEKYERQPRPFCGQRQQTAVAADLELPTRPLAAVRDEVQFHNTSMGQAAPPANAQGQVGEPVERLFPAAADDGASGSGRESQVAGAGEGARAATSGASGLMGGVGALHLAAPEEEPEISLDWITKPKVKEWLKQRRQEKRDQLKQQEIFGVVAAETTSEHSGFAFSSTSTSASWSVEYAQTDLPWWERTQKDEKSNLFGQTTNSTTLFGTTNAVVDSSFSLTNGSTSSSRTGPVFTPPTRTSASMSTQQLGLFSTSSTNSSSHEKVKEMKEEEQPQSQPNPPSMPVFLLGPETATPRCNDNGGSVPQALSLHGPPTSTSFAAGEQLLFNGSNKNEAKAPVAGHQLHIHLQDSQHDVSNYSNSLFGAVATAHEQLSRSANNSKGLPDHQNMFLRSTSHTSCSGMLGAGGGQWTGFHSNEASTSGSKTSSISISASSSRASSAGRSTAASLGATGGFSGATASTSSSQGKHNRSTSTSRQAGGGKAVRGNPQQSPSPSSRSSAPGQNELCRATRSSDVAFCSPSSRKSSKGPLRKQRSSEDIVRHIQSTRRTMTRSASAIVRRPSTPAAAGLEQCGGGTTPRVRVRASTPRATRVGAAPTIALGSNHDNVDGKYTGEDMERRGSQQGRKARADWRF
ncbi:unnamed protein product [Amoebophrya sp. A120]|nr:unnamed protein product [Amoebophrya sp. A120]|eukprot:GSA120T00000785001.1